MQYRFCRAPPPLTWLPAVFSRPLVSIRIWTIIVLYYPYDQVHGTGYNRVRPLQLLSCNRPSSWVITSLAPVNASSIVYTSGLSAVRSAVQCATTAAVSVFRFLLSQHHIPISSPPHRTSVRATSCISGYVSLLPMMQSALCLLRSYVCGSTPTPLPHTIEQFLVFFWRCFFCFAVSFFLFHPHIMPSISSETQSQAYTSVCLLRVRDLEGRAKPPRLPSASNYYPQVLLCQWLWVDVYLLGAPSAVHDIWRRIRSTYFSMRRFRRMCFPLVSGPTQNTRQVSRNPAVHIRGPYPCWRWIYVNNTTTWRSKAA